MAESTNGLLSIIASSVRSRRPSVLLVHPLYLGTHIFYVSLPILQLSAPFFASRLLTLGKEYNFDKELISFGFHADDNNISLIEDVLVFLHTGEIPDSIYTSQKNISDFHNILEGLGCALPHNGVAKKKPPMLGRKDNNNNEGTRSISMGVSSRYNFEKDAPCTVCFSEVCTNNREYNKRLRSKKSRLHSRKCDFDIIFCGDCGCSVHAACANIPSKVVESDDDWLCPKCQYLKTLKKQRDNRNRREGEKDNNKEEDGDNDEEDMRCVYCKHQGIVECNGMKFPLLMIKSRTRKGWAHSICETICGRSPSNEYCCAIRERSKNVCCSYCERSGGNLYKCLAHRCTVVYHPVCALLYGAKNVIYNGPDAILYKPEGEEEEETEEVEEVEMIDNRNNNSNNNNKNRNRNRVKGDESDKEDDSEDEDIYSDGYIYEEVSPSLESSEVQKLVQKLVDPRVTPLEIVVPLCAKHSKESFEDLLLSKSKGRHSPFYKEWDKYVEDSRKRPVTSFPGSTSASLTNSTSIHSSSSSSSSVNTSARKESTKQKTLINNNNNNNENNNENLSLPNKHVRSVKRNIRVHFAGVQKDITKHLQGALERVKKIKQLCVELNMENIVSGIPKLPDEGSSEQPKETLKQFNVEIRETCPCDLVFLKSSKLVNFILGLSQIDTKRKKASQPNEQEETITVPIASFNRYYPSSIFVIFDHYNAAFTQLLLPKWGSIIGNITQQTILNTFKDTQLELEQLKKKLKEENDGRGKKLLRQFGLHEGTFIIFKQKRFKELLLSNTTSQFEFLKSIIRYNDDFLHSSSLNIVGNAIFKTISKPSSCFIFQEKRILIIYMSNSKTTESIPSIRTKGIASGLEFLFVSVGSSTSDTSGTTPQTGKNLLSSSDSVAPNEWNEDNKEGIGDNNPPFTLSKTGDILHVNIKDYSTFPNLRTYKMELSVDLKVLITVAQSLAIAMGGHCSRVIVMSPNNIREDDEVIRTRIVGCTEIIDGRGTIALFSILHLN